MFEEQKYVNIGEFINVITQNFAETMLLLTEKYLHPIPNSIEETDWDMLAENAEAMWKNSESAKQADELANHEFIVQALPDILSDFIATSSDSPFSVTKAYQSCTAMDDFFINLNDLLLFSKQWHPKWTEASHELSQAFSDDFKRVVAKAEPHLAVWSGKDLPSNILVKNIDTDKIGAGFQQRIRQTIPNFTF